MNRREFKISIYELLNQDVDGLTIMEKINLTKKLLIDYQKDVEDSLDTSNKRQAWTDEQLEIILSTAPTRENCARFSRLFKRGYGSVEQIYRWAATSDKEIEETGRSENSFIQQIKRVAKKIGFCAG